MMYMPSIFGENLMDDFFNDTSWLGYEPAYSKSTANLMKTDIKEHENNYEMKIDLPGFKKEDLKLQLKDGYLNISAAHNENKDEKDKSGKVVRQERYTGSMQRSFYVGENVKQSDIAAKFENGVLALNIPKVEPKKEVPEEKYIAIEG